MSVLAACSPGGSAEPAGPVNVILIVVDTLRADHLGTFGYAGNTSPSIDAFASRSTVFDAATSQAPHTLPSVAQIMSSRYRQGQDLDEAFPTLAEILQGAGFETAAIVENANFEFTRNAHGLSRGFDHFYRNGLLDRQQLENQHWKTNTPADSITAQARHWLEQRDADRPFFLWLHYFDPHDPYAPPFSEAMEQLTWEGPSELTGDIRATKRFNRRGGPDVELSEVDRAHLIALYDAEVRYLDRSLADLFAYLDERNLTRDSLIVLTADHGESLGEHGYWNHGVSLHQAEIHVPLIIKFPGQRKGVRRGDPAEVIDILPTITGALDLDLDHIFNGDDLGRQQKDFAFVFWKDSWVVRTRRWKLMSMSEDLQLLDLESDPGERENLASRHPEVVARLLEARRNRLLELGVSERELEEAAEESLEALRSLGYLR